MSLERRKQSCVVQLENTPTWEYPKVPNREFQTQISWGIPKHKCEIVLFPLLHRLLLSPYEKNQGII